MKPTEPQAKAGGRLPQLPPVAVLHDLLVTSWACGVTTDGRVDPARLLVTSSVKSSLIPPDRLSFCIICSPQPGVQFPVTDSSGYSSCSLISPPGSTEWGQLCDSAVWLGSLAHGKVWVKVYGGEF